MKLALISLTTVIAASCLTGCGKQAKAPTGVSPQEISVKIKKADTSNDTNWDAYPTQVTKVTMPSQGLEFLVVRITAKKLGFNDAAKIGFPVTVRQEVQFRTNLYLGKDKLLYISDLGTAEKPKFYQVGAYGSKAIDLYEGDSIKLRFDHGYNMKVAIANSSEGATKLGLTVEMELKAMPPMLLEPPLLAFPIAGPVAGPTATAPNPIVVATK